MDRKMCKIEVVATACYDNSSKSFGIGYLNNIPILFKPCVGFDPATQPACRNGCVGFTDEFCIVNSTSVTCYDGLIFFINDRLWRVKKGRWTIEEDK